MNQIKETRVWITIRYFIKWIITAYIIGALGGVIGGAFANGIAYVTKIRTHNDWLLFCMPLGGLLIIFLYRLLNEKDNKGTNMVLASISSDEPVTKGTGPLIFISTIITHLVGGSAGREGAALQLGGWLGYQVGHISFVHMDDKEQKIVIMCGMSAVFSALFGTPVAAAFFSMEVISVGIIHYSAMLPCLLAAFLGKDIAKFMGVEHDHFFMAQMPTLDYATIQPVVLLGILIALLSILFITVLHHTEHAFNKYIPNSVVRMLVASALFIGITLLIGTRVYSGGSIVLIEESLNGEVAYEAFLLKMILTALTIAGGFKGGEIIPTLCIGASFGCCVGNIIGFEPSLMAACGMIGLFAAVTNCPISSILIGLELFSGRGLAYFAVVVSLSYSLSGYYSLYSTQKFVYGKLKNTYLNRTPNK